MIIYSDFYKRYGIRKISQLLSPPLPKMELLQLPKESVLHFLSDNPLVVGPNSDEYLFREITRPIMVSHIVENGDNKGSPRKLPTVLESLIKNYHIKNRRYKRMMSLEASTRDAYTLVIYNYGFIHQSYKYIRSVYSRYYEWWNTQSAMIKNIEEVSTKTNRQQYVLCKLPPTLPSIPDLVVGSAGITQTSINKFPTNDSLVILELWKWFGPNRSESMFSKLSEFALSRTNLIFQESGKWFVLNLGMIEQWRAATKDELKEDGDLSTKGYDSKQIQKLFLRLLVSLSHVRDTIPVDKPIDKLVDDKKVTVIDTSVNTGKTIIQDVVTPQEYLEHADGADDQVTDIKHDEAFYQSIEDDLALLEQISKKALPEYVESNVKFDISTMVETVPDSLEEGIMKVADKLAELGTMSALQYRNYQASSVKYKTIVAPDGKSTLDDFINIPREDLVITDKPTIRDSKAVFDKSMLSSSLLRFDKDYITKVHEKDVASMVLNIQHAGISITDYEVEQIEDVMGSYKMYTVRANPITGTSSTLRFKLPVISEDGTFVANGITYRLRKQRGEVPIRKVAPDRVALTSYYGKVFVSRNPNRINNYDQWIRNQVMAIGLDDANDKIQELNPGSVFDNHFVCPKIYSILAMGFRNFAMKTSIPNLGDNLIFHLNLDISKRMEKYGQLALDLYEKDGAVIIGYNEQFKSFLIVDKDSTFYYTEGDKEIDCGTIETLLDLTTDNVPINYAELQVMGKSIPVGIILAYELGLEHLIRLLGVEYRRVNVGTRVNLDTSEFAIVFSDETLVFKKDHKEASMILAGFNEYRKITKNYSVYDFDKQGVYLNLLEANKISISYLRELNLLYQMFVDPITRELLIEMNEPIDFRGLLIRSCVLLMNDQHPDELDPAYMRIKGYERMAGAVYSELVRAIRSHSGRLGKAKLPIDLNPYAVWKNISTDPSMSIVSNINPIENLKQMEAVTMSGTGGRNSRSMTKRTRVYHKNDMGTISEGTVDSGDVAINISTSADPQFTTLRGLSKRFELDKTGITALLSTPALVSPSSDKDD